MKALRVELAFALFPVANARGALGAALLAGVAAATVGCTSVARVENQRIVRHAQTVGEHDRVQDTGAPTLADLLGAVTSVGMYHYNFETIELLRGAADDWSRQAAERGHRLDTHVSEVAFDDLGDAEERALFNRVATSFDLADETIDRLIEVGGRLLRESPEFRSFMARGRSPESP